MKVLAITKTTLPKLREVRRLEYLDCDRRCTFREVEIAGERYFTIPPTLGCRLSVTRLVEYALTENVNLLWFGAVA